MMKNKAFLLYTRMLLLKQRAKNVLCSNSGEGFVDTAVKVLMAVVIGALVLAGLYSLFGDTILPTLQEKIKEMFEYSD